MSSALAAPMAAFDRPTSPPGRRRHRAASTLGLDLPHAARVGYAEDVRRRQDRTQVVRWS
ncbi:MAG: hypothetical protein U0470_08895 [Anaerolineae bacterium]